MVQDPHDVLSAELEEARQQLAALDHQLRHRPDFGLGVGSPEIITWEMNLARRTVLLERIAEIEQAMQRRASGIYGVCEICGAAIDKERLQILPYTQRCVRCAGLQPGSRAPARLRVST